MKKLVFLFIFVVTLFAKAPVYKVLMSDVVPNGYHEDVYKKAIVLMTEARLYLQKKYRKKITFEYIHQKLKDKNKIIKLLKENNARFYVHLEIIKKKAKKNLQKVYYNLVIFDKKKKRFKTIKTKAIIRDKMVVKISQGSIKSTGKKIAKFMKK